MDYVFEEGCFPQPYAPLSVFYSHQFVQNDASSADKGKGKETVHALHYQKILKGTLVGTVYLGTNLIQTFSSEMNGEIKFTDVGTPKVKVVGGSLGWENGKLILQWNEKPGSCHVVASYEYEMEAQYCPPKKPEVNFVEPTFDKFFTSEELADIAKEAGTVACWDFNCALGDTIMEKYESLYVKCIEMTNVLLQKGAAGYFWIVTSPEIASIFETATCGLRPVSSKEFGSKMIGWVYPLGLPSYKGAVNAKWRLYTDSLMPSNTMLIGCNDKREDASHYARMMIYNFVI